MSVDERTQAPGPKRILALDGGGVRGILTLGFLARMEKLLRERYQNPRFLLCDYFDLIGGTSTGSIIASGLAMGMDTATLIKLYKDLSKDIFKGKNPFWFLSRKFNAAPLEKYLKANFGEITLSDPSLRTGLCIISKRVDTGSTWVMVNNPRSRYFEQDSQKPIHALIRASTAAPTYFNPNFFEVDPGKNGVFVDGGVSMHNNPALQLFLLTKIHGFGYNWASGAENLMIVSVGTGASTPMIKINEIEDGANALTWANAVPNMLMADASELGQIILQMLSKSPTRWHFDSIMKSLDGQMITSEPQLHYLRYDAPLEATTLQEIHMTHLEKELDQIREMSNPKYIEELFNVGANMADRKIKEGHFPEVFDVV